MFFVSLTDSLHTQVHRVNAYTCSIQIIGDQATAKEPGNGIGLIQSQRPNVTLRISPSHSNFLPAHFPFHREWSPTWGHVSCTPPPPGFIKQGGQSTLHWIQSQALSWRQISSNYAHKHNSSHNCHLLFIQQCNGFTWSSFWAPLPWAASTAPSTSRRVYCRETPLHTLEISSNNKI